VNTTYEYYCQLTVVSHPWCVWRFFGFVFVNTVIHCTKQVNNELIIIDEWRIGARLSFCLVFFDFCVAAVFLITLLLYMFVSLRVINESVSHITPKWFRSSRMSYKIPQRCGMSCDNRNCVGRTRSNGKRFLV